MQRFTIGAIGLLCVANSAWGQVVTDGSVGPASTLTGAQVEIAEALGRRAGANLFHSFERFDIPNGGSATFTGANSVRHIIARITGASASHLNGQLAVEIPNSSLWLFNPEGILFGPQATVNIDGELHISTAESVEFADGRSFTTKTGKNFNFTVASPQAFGLFGPGKLRIENSQLELPTGKRASLQSARIEIVGGMIEWREGTLNLAATDGGLSLSDGASLQANGADGTVLIETDLLSMDASTISVSNDVDQDGVGGIKVDAQSIDLQNSASLVTEALAAGLAPTLELDAQDIRLSNFSQVASNSRSAGAAADINLVTDRLLIEKGSFASSEAFSDGDAGNVELLASEIELVGDQSGAFSGIASQAAAGSTGNAGSIFIETKNLEILFGAQISSDTFAFGDGGLVQIRADDVHLSGQGAPVLTAITGQSNPGSSGLAGSVDIRARRLSLIDGGLVTANTLADGAGGTVKIAVDHILIDNTQGRSFTGITSNTALGTGKAGDVLVAAREIDMRGPSVVSSITFGDGDGGRVDIDAEAISIDGQGIAGFAGISSQANIGSNGRAGQVSVRAQQLDIENGGTINSSTFGSGDAGLVEIEADQLLISANGLGLATGVISDAQAGSGRAGRVSVKSESIEIRDGGQISSRTLTAGNAGAIEVEAPMISISCADCGQFTGITSQTSGFGDAGSINISAERLLMSGGEIGTSTTSRGQAGSATVQVNQIELENGSRIGSSSTGQGNAGNIGVFAADIRADQSRVETSGSGAQGGRIDVVAFNLFLANQSTITSTGIRPAEDASLINVSANELVLNRTRVESLFTDTSSPLTITTRNTGEANLLGDITVISTDSVVAAATSIDVTGLDSELASDLIDSRAEFATIDVDLASPCAAAITGSKSSFSLMAKRLQRRPGPIDPLDSCRNR